MLEQYQGYFRHIQFTGSYKFFAAAAEALTGKSQIPKTLQRAGSLRPSNRCIVCDEPLGYDLAILLAPDGQRAILQFLHKDCSELLAEKWPGHVAMYLPNAALHPDSFFRAVDVNQNGVLEQDEVRCVMAAFWREDMASFDQEFESRWQTWDTKKRGSLLPEDLVCPDCSTAPKQLPRSGAGPLNVDLEELPMSLLEWIRLRAGDGLAEDTTNDY